MSEKNLSILSYVLGWVSGLFVLVLEKSNKTVRFHALQSTLTFLSITVLNIAAWLVPLLGGLIRSGLGLVTVALWIWLIYSVINDKLVRVPIVGDVAWKQIHGE